MADKIIDNAKNDWADKSIEVKDIIAAADPQFVKDYTKYSVGNPHPLYGTDPNIINEYGHTAYPKWVYPNGPANEGFIVNSAAEEAEKLGKAPAPWGK
jgi:hypothetical protein